MQSSLLALIASLSLLSSSLGYTESALEDKITNLPGTEALDIKFDQFSGYLSVPGTNGELTKHLHYWFVTSENDPANDVLGFWTNGGPGCSGLLGFLTEQGPFLPQADGKLKLNEYAWNKVSNMVFIESPAGVGFSYADNPEDYNIGDSQTAIDNYNLIQAFLIRFPEFKTNPVVFTSESYGGHYCPTLAKEVVDQNAAGNNPKINFKGFAVGNPYTDVYSGTGAMLDTFWGHQLVSKPTWDAYSSKCVKSVRPNAIECAKLQLELNQEIGNLNPYALDWPVCVKGTETLSSKGAMQRHWFKSHVMEASIGRDMMKQIGAPLKGDYEPCAENYEIAFLNSASVKKAIHVKDDIKWSSCSAKVNYNMSDSQISTAPIYNYLIDGGFGLDILVYSGDDDSVCATIGTQEWIWGLGYTVAGKPWQPYTVNDQTAGYQTQWEKTKLGFVTIHGAGHEVPTYKPEVALDMWTRYLKGEFTSA